MADVKDTKSGSGGECCPECAKPLEISHCKFCPSCGSNIADAKSTTKTLDEILHQSLPLIRMIYCAKGIKDAKWNTTIGELIPPAKSAARTSSGWDHSVIRHLNEYCIPTLKDTDIALYAYHEGLIDKGRIDDVWPGRDIYSRLIEYQKMTPSLIDKSVKLAYNARYRHGGISGLNVVPTLAVCGVPHRFVTNYPTPHHNSDAGLEYFWSTLVDMISYGIQQPVCGYNFAFSCEPSVQKIQSLTSAEDMKNNQSATVKLSVKQMQGLADITDNKHETLKRENLCALDEKAKKDQTVLNSLIAQLPDVFYYSPSANTFYDECQMAYLLKPVDGYMQTKLHELKRYTLMDKVIMILSPEMGTLIAMLKDKRSIVNMLKAAPPTVTSSSKTLTTFFGVDKNVVKHKSGTKGAYYWKLTMRAAENED